MRTKVRGKKTQAIISDDEAMKFRIKYLETGLDDILPVSYTHLTLPTIYSV